MKRDETRMTRVRMCYIWLRECNDNQFASATELNDAISQMFRVIGLNRARSISTRVADHCDGKGDNLFQTHYISKKRCEYRVSNPDQIPKWYQKWLDGEEFWYDEGKGKNGTNHTGKVSKFHLPERDPVEPYLPDSIATETAIEAAENEGFIPVVGNEMWFYQGRFISHEELKEYAGFVYDLTCLTPAWNNGRDFRYAGGKRIKTSPDFRTYRGSGTVWVNFLRAGYEDTNGPLEIRREIKELVPKIKGETVEAEKERVKEAEARYLEEIDAANDPEYANRTNEAIGYGLDKPEPKGKSKSNGTRTAKPPVVFVGKEVDITKETESFARQRLLGAGTAILSAMNGVLEDATLKTADVSDPTIADALSELKSMRDMVSNWKTNIENK